MILVGREKLSRFTAKHTDAKRWVENWIADVEGSTWSTTMDVKERYRTVSFLEGNQAIFNVKGNSYRVIVTINYAAGIVVVNWIGTHAEYDRR